MNCANLQCQEDSIFFKSTGKVNTVNMSLLIVGEDIKHVELSMKFPIHGVFSIQ
jgi:uncharacterized protein with HEPN domain